MHVYTYMYGCIHARARVWKPEDKWKQLVLSCMFWGQNSGFQAWWQVLLPTEQSHWPSPTVCVGLNGLAENDQIIHRSWYPPEMEGMTLLLNMPLVLVKGHKEIELEVSWECSPCWLVFVFLEGSMQALGGEHVSVVSFCWELCLLYTMTGQALCAHWYNSGMTLRRVTVTLWLQSYCLTGDTHLVPSTWSKTWGWWHHGPNKNIKLLFP